METTLKATAGEWTYRKTIDPKYNQQVYEIDAEPHTECLITVWDAVNDEEQLANAKLVIGAKALLTACQKLLSEVETEGLLEETLIAIEQAVAKSTIQDATA